MRRALQLLVVLLPWSLRRVVYQRLFGWQIAPTARVGLSLVGARKVVLGPDAEIGSFNVIRDLDLLELGEGASIATRNRILGSPAAAAIFTKSPNRESVLRLGKYAGITVGHEIDVMDRVELGDYSIIAGFRSQLLTHHLDLVRDDFRAAPVIIGERAAVMTGCTLLAGSTLPDRSILAAGSVITTPLNEELTLYSGNPAQKQRSLPERLKFFHRTGLQPQIHEARFGTRPGDILD